MFLNLFKKAGPDDSGSVPFFSAVMDGIAADACAAFERQYGWKAEGGAGEIECLIISKFLMDQALISTFCDRISKKRLRNLVTILDLIYEGKINKLHPHSKPEEFSDRLREYSVMLSQNKSPLCWQLVAGRFTGLNLAEEKPTVEKFPQFLPELFIKARESLKQIIVAIS